MAVRRQDLEEYARANVYRFPAAAVRRRARREQMIRRRRRAVAAAVVVLVVALSLLGGGTSVASRPGAPPAVTVAPGDTLWELAGRYAPEGLDRRVYIHALIELNALEGMPRAGQKLRLPR